MFDLDDVVWARSYAEDHGAVCFHSGGAARRLLPSYVEEIKLAKPIERRPAKTIWRRYAEPRYKAYLRELDEQERERRRLEQEREHIAMRVGHENKIRESKEWIEAKRREQQRLRTSPDVLIFEELRHERLVQMMREVYGDLNEAKR